MPIDRHRIIQISADLFQILQIKPNIPNFHSTFGAYFNYYCFTIISLEYFGFDPHYDEKKLLFHIKIELCLTMKKISKKILATRPQSGIF